MSCRALTSANQCVSSFLTQHEIGDEALAALLEAARWAPSANSQPCDLLLAA